MRARLVTACSWLIVTAAATATGCRLDPIPEQPIALEPTSDAGRDVRTDTAVPPRDGPLLPPQPQPQPQPPPIDPDGSLPGPETGVQGTPVDASGDTVAPDVVNVDTPPPVDRPPSVDLPVVVPPPDAAPDQPPPDTTLQGLVAHWRFDENTGNRAADLTGGGNTATLHNGTAWERSRVARGPQDYAVQLDGENDYVQATVGNAIPRIEASKSISFWFTIDQNAPEASGNQRTCLALANPDMRIGIQIGTDRDRLAAWSWGENQGFVIDDDEIGSGPHHVAYTFDNNTHRLYVDGTLADSSTADPQEGRATTLYLGTYSPPNELCAGQIDDLRIHNRPLTPAEVTQLSRR